MVPQQYCLRWKHHHSNVQSMFSQLLEKERFCDVTLYCSPSFATQVPNKDTVDPQNIRGVSLRAHRVVLAACSELLGALLGAHEAHGEPVLVIDGAEPRHLRALLDYMYTGEMNVHHSQLAGLLKTAEDLRIKGLTDIRWNNKDEPPDCSTGAVTTVVDKKTDAEKIITQEKNPYDIKIQDVRSTNKKIKRSGEISDIEVRDDDDKDKDKYNLNGGPPPLIKLPTKDKVNPVKREQSEPESPSPKRQRVTSCAENTDEENAQIKIKTEREQEWRHGNLDITAERVVGWGGGLGAAPWSRDGSDEEWDPPADIGSFLHTKLRVDGDNSADEESDGSACAPHASSSSSTASTAHIDYVKPNKTSKQDPRFTDVVKLNDYLQHGRRPQFWEENYVKRVMEAVRLKELEMKQAAEILGVSYGTLYGRYRDVYGCINRPYRTARDVWQAKGPSAIMERVQRGDLSLQTAALALGVNPANLASYVADVAEGDKDWEVELDPAVKVSRSFTATTNTKTRKIDKVPGKKLSGVADDDLIPTNVTHDATAAHSTNTGKWPSIRLASLESLRSPPSPPSGPPSPCAPSSLPPAGPLAGPPACVSTGAPAGPPPSPSQLMRTRPDLTIVAARKDS
ncbi:unnamed protein product [Danaus chrysippus]|uniref:(African queen) hypothetical protein n=1 Tax=Danaus chrysippus TaxID=151541 RepID=A0A8J2QYR3_9NEOP|nr:unnamed protein product [Danaus chrysippus]